MAEPTEKITILLQAQHRDFMRAMDTANRRLARFEQQATRNVGGAARTVQQNIDRMGGSILSMTARAGPAIGVMLAAFTGGAVRQAITAMADLDDQARQIGVDVESLQGLTGGLSLAGINATESAAALETFAQRLGDAANGEGQLFDALKANGIAFRDQNGELRSTMDVLEDYSALIAGAGSEAERLSIAADAFGRGGRLMGDALSGGPEALREMIAAAREAGLVIDEEIIARAAELDDRFEVLTTRAGNMFKEMAVVGGEAFAGLVMAAEDFFALFRDDSNQQILEASGLVGILGADTVAAMQAAGAATDQQEAALESLLETHGDLIMEVAQVAAMLRQTAQDAATDYPAMAGHLMAVADAMELQVSHLADGTTNSKDFTDEVTRLGNAADTTLVSLQSLSGVTFGGTMSGLAAMMGRLNGIAAAAAAARAAINNAAVEDPRGDTGNAANFSAGLQDATGNAPRTSIIPPTRPVDIDFGYSPPSGGGGSPGGGGGAARVGEYAQAVAALRTEVNELTIEAAEIASVTVAGTDLGDAMEYARKRAELLIAAQEEGRDITPELRAEIDALAQSYVVAGANAEEAADRLDRMRQNAERGADAMADLMMGILDGSTSAKDALVGLLAEIAKVQLRNALIGAAGSGGPLGWLGSLLTPRASGGPVSAGSPYMVGERGPEPFIPAVNGRILSVPQAQAALRGGAGGGAVQVIGGDLTLSDDGRIMARMRVISAQTTGQGMAAQSKTLRPQVMSQDERYG